MRLQSCAVIVLASGLSQRFGPDNKLLANLNGRPVLGHVLDYLAEIDFGGRYSVTAVSGAAALTAAAGYRNIHNADQALGLSHARALGAQQVIDDGYESAFVVLGDMPFVTADHIRAVLGKALVSDIVMSTYDDVLMPPAFFAATPLSGLAKNKPGRKHSGIGPRVDVCALSAHQARDIDTPEDLIVL